MAINNINLFDGLNLNPIPLEFSNALTTTEWLGALQAKVNECVTYVNSLSSTTNEYTDEQITAVKEIINNNDIAIRSLIALTLDESKSYTDSEIDAVKVSVTALATSTAQSISSLQSKDITLQTQITQLFNMLSQGNIFVINPINGQLVEIQTAVNALYDFINSNNGQSFTAQMYDALSLTASAYDALLVSARAYDSNWSTIFYN